MMQTPIECLRVLRKAVTPAMVGSEILRYVDAVLEHHDLHSREPHVIYVGSGWAYGSFRLGERTVATWAFAPTDQVRIVLEPAK